MNKILYPILAIMTLCFSGLKAPLFSSDLPSYSHDFSVKKDFSHTFPCYFYQGEFHIFNPESGYLCWETTTRTSEENRIEAKVITADPDATHSENHAGILYRLTNTDNALLFYVYPASKTFGIGYWEVTLNNPKGNWKTLEEKSNDAVRAHENILKIVNLKERSILFVNGTKVYDFSYPQTENIPYNGFVGFFSSKGSHFHFDDLKIWKNSSENPEKTEILPEKPFSFPQDYPERSPEYENLGELLVSYSFNGRQDSPFNEKKANHTEKGKYLIWSDGGLRPFSDTLSAENYFAETSLRIGNSRQSGWAGITVKSDLNQYYALMLNPFLKKIKLERVLSGQKKVLFETDAKNLRMGENEENILGLSVENQKVTGYLNGKRIQRVEDASELTGPSYGLISETNDPVFFGFIRVYSLKESFWDQIKGWLIFLLIVFLLVFWIKRRKKKKKAQSSENLKEKIIREILKEMPSKKVKRVSDHDLIFRYQITKKEAEDILSDLATRYGGYFDSDSEGNLFVSFD